MGKPGEWRELHIEEFNHLHLIYSGDKIEKNGMGRAYSTYG
jgi:hypothetical protein